MSRGIAAVDTAQIVPSPGSTQYTVLSTQHRGDGALGGEAGRGWMLESKGQVSGPARRVPANPARSGRKQRYRALACAAGSPVPGTALSFWLLAHSSFFRWDPPSLCKRILRAKSQR